MSGVSKMLSLKKGFRFKEWERACHFNNANSAESAAEGSCHCRTPQSLLSLNAPPPSALRTSPVSSPRRPRPALAGAMSHRQIDESTQLHPQHKCTRARRTSSTINPLPDTAPGHPFTTQAQTHVQSHTHTNTNTNTHTLTHILSQSHTLTLSLSHNHTLTHTHRHSHTRTHSLTHPPTHLQYPPTHSRTHSLTSPHLSSPHLTSPHLTSPHSLTHLAQTQVHAFKNTDARKDAHLHTHKQTRRNKDKQRGQ